tara:strand:+ start:86 stop:547 length:462 start_codon:yes stop_codon:yes gene_type:complete
MNLNVFIYFFLVVLCWTFNPFIKKVIMKKGKLNTDEYFLINHFVVTSILVLYFIYLFNTRKCNTNCIKSLDKYDVFYIVLGALTSILGARLLLSIIQQNDISFMVAHIQPIVISLTFVIGYMFFSETLTTYKIIGIGLVILGILFLNKKNIKA